MDTGLTGRTVVVTGATANIGRGIALAFAGEGAAIAVVGRDEAQGRRVCDDLIGCATILVTVHTALAE